MGSVLIFKPFGVGAIHESPAANKEKRAIRESPLPRAADIYICRDVVSAVPYRIGD